MWTAPAAVTEALKQTTANHSWDWAWTESTNPGLARALTFLKYSLSLESLVFLKIRMFYASWANFITYLIYNLFICKIFCTGVGRSNEKTDLYIVSYKADRSRWDSGWPGVCRLSATLWSPSGRPVAVSLAPVCRKATRKGSTRPEVFPSRSCTASPEGSHPRQKVCSACCALSGWARTSVSMCPLCI